MTGTVNIEAAASPCDLHQVKETTTETSPNNGPASKYV